MERNGSAERRLHVANGTTFKIPKRYNHLEVIGKGSYGMVCSAVDSVRNNAPVAIKKITPMAAHSVDAKHVLREVRVMRYLGEHENIVTLEDLFCNEEDDELYIVMELLDSDLHRIIQSNQALSRKHHQVFMIQILRGVEFLHRNGIIHRDLKPGNILLTRNCQLRISDFGLARELPRDTDATAEARRDGDGITEHVVTRWYRPPELMLSPNGFYGFPVDVWSVGCIFGELLGRRPLFPGSSFVDQLSLIFDVLGAPAPDEVAHIRGAQARKFLDKLKGRAGVSFSDLIPGTPDDAAALLESLLLFDPLKRCTPGEALDHPFFRDLGEDTTLDVAPPTGLDFDFERKGVPRSRLKELIAAEVDHFQAGGANLMLHPKKHRHRQQQHRAAPHAIDHAKNGDPPVKAMAAAAAASSAPFSSDNDCDGEEDDDGGDNRSRGGANDNPESDRCYSSDSTEDKEFAGAGGVRRNGRSPLPSAGAAPDDAADALAEDDVACLDAASLQSSRLCPKEDATEDDYSDEATSGGDDDDDDDADDNNNDEDDVTVSSLSRASSLSMSSPENDGSVEDEPAALPRRRGDGTHGGEGRRTYYEDKRAESSQVEGGAGRARGRRAGGVAIPGTSTIGKAAAARTARTARRPAATHYSPVRTRGSTHGSADFSPIPEEEGQDSPTPRAGSDHDASGGGGGGEAEAARARESKSSVAFPQFDSLAESSPSEASESPRGGLAESRVSVPLKPARETSVAGFARGSDGWDSDSSGAATGTGVGRRLFVSLMPPSPPPQPTAMLVAPEAGSGKTGNHRRGGGPKSGESEDRDNFFSGASVRGGDDNGSSESSKDGPSSSQASEMLRRERAERAWQVVGEARAKVKAREDAAAAATTAAAAAGAGPGQARAGLRARHPAIIAAKRRTAAAAAAAAAAEPSRRVKLLDDVRRSGGGRKGTEAAKAELSGCPAPKHGSVESTRRAPASGSTLLLESEDSSWLRREGGSSGSATKPTSGDGSKGSGKIRQTPVEFRPSPLEKSADPFSDFFSGQTSLVTHEDPFCDYVSGKTTISAGAVAAARLPAPAAAPTSAAPAAPTSAAPAAPTVPAGAGARLPVMKVGQKLKVRGASLLMATPDDKSGDRQPFFGDGARGGHGAEKDAGPRHQLRAPVASVQREHLNPLVLPAKRFEHPMAGGGAASVASSRGSPPPVPPPLGQRRRHGSRRARAGTRGSSLVREYHALPKAAAAAAADGANRVHAPDAAAGADAGAGRGRQRAGLPPTGARVEAKGRRGGAPTQRGRHRSTVAAAAEKSRASSASEDAYYSINDVVTLKLPDRLAAPSSERSNGTTNTSGQERGGVDGPLSPIPHNQLTQKPCNSKPRSIPPIQAWKWTGGQTTRTAPPTAAVAGARKGGNGESSEKERPASATTAATATTTAALPHRQPLSPMPGRSARPTVSLQGAVPAAGTTVADDGDCDSPTTTTTTISTAATASCSAPAGKGDEGPAAGGEVMSLASAMYAADREREAARAKKKHHGHPCPNQTQLPQLDKPREYPVGAPAGAGQVHPPRAATACDEGEQAERDNDDGIFEDDGRVGGDGTGDSAASAEHKFTLLKRLWKRSNAGRSAGKQGAISAANRHAPCAASFDAGPSPRSEDEDADATPGPVLVSQTAATFPIPQKIAGKVLPSSPQHQQQQRRGPPVTAAAAILSAADKSHKRSASGATSLTCGTSPASSATSGFRGEGSQQLLVPHVRAGSHPAAAATAAAAAAESASSALPTSGGRKRRDNIIRAVQFAGEMPAQQAADFSASAQNRGGGGGDAGMWGARGPRGGAGYPREFKNGPSKAPGTAAAGGGQRCGIRDNICRAGGGGRDGGRQQKVCPAPPSPGAAASKPPRPSSTVYP
eukprot:g6498.t1